MNDFENVIIEAETLGIVYDFVKSCLEETEDEIKWYRDQYFSKTNSGQKVEDWINDGWATEVKRKQVFLTVISNLYKQLYEMERSEF